MGRLDLLTNANQRPRGWRATGATTVCVGALFVRRLRALENVSTWLVNFDAYQQFAVARRDA
jgi:hypothetical protein